LDSFCWVRVETYVYCHCSILIHDLDLASGKLGLTGFDQSALSVEMPINMRFAFIVANSAGFFLRKNPMGFLRFHVVAPNWNFSLSFRSIPPIKSSPLIVVWDFLLSFPDGIFFGGSLFIGIR